jgi:hypothetical protein
VPIGKSSGVVAVSTTIRNLTLGTTYHFRLVAAQGSYPTTFSAGNDLKFTTLGPSGRHSSNTNVRASLGSRTLVVQHGRTAIPFSCTGTAGGACRARISITARGKLGSRVKTGVTLVLR